MYNNVLFKVDGHNDGMILKVVSETNFLLNEVMENPLRFLDNQGALEFTNTWTLQSMNIIGGNGCNIQNIVQIVILNQDVRSMSEKWLLMKTYPPIALQAIEVGVSAQVSFVADTVSTD